MAVGQPLTIECMSFGVGGKNLSSKMPDSLWKQLRQKALQVYSNQCGICHAEAERLSLHESWEFFWHPEIAFSISEWHTYAGGKGWQLYTGRDKRYEVGGKQVHLQMLSLEGEARVPTLIKSGFTPYIDRRGGFRYAEDEGLRPYQVLAALVIVCPHCHSIKNLRKVRLLAEEGKFDIEPVFQHYMRVNKVSRRKALKQWDDACNEAANELIAWNNELTRWTQWVQTYGSDGTALNVYTALDEWIAFVRVSGVEAVSPHLFMQAL